jgi:exodeoxyribonuclease-1
MIDFLNPKPLFHVSTRYGVDRAYTAALMPIAPHPSQHNVVLMFDLAQDPSFLLRASPESLAEQLFKPYSERTEDDVKVGLHLFHVNRSPFLARVTDLSLIEASVTPRGFDKDLCTQHWAMIRDQSESVYKKVQLAYGLDPKVYVNGDPELNLYGGFASEADLARMAQLTMLPPSEWSSIVFDKADYNALLFRFRARNAPETLTEAEAQQWEEFVLDRLETGSGLDFLTLDQFEQDLVQAKANESLDDHQRHVLEQLEQWLHEKRINPMVAAGPSSASRLPKSSP